MTTEEVRAVMTQAMRAGLVEKILRGAEVSRERAMAGSRYLKAYGNAQTAREKQLLNALHSLELMLLEDERGPWIPGALAMPALHLIREAVAS